MIIPGQVTKYWIPSKDVGTFRTLQIMRTVVNESLIDPYVVYRAKQIVSGCDGKDEFCQSQKIMEWVKSHTKFIRDPSGVELLHTPKFQLQAIERNGELSIDCDDFSMLSAAMGKAVGLPAKFVVLGFLENNAPYTHVFTILKVRDKWYPIDQKYGYPISKSNITRKRFFNV